MLDELFGETGGAIAQFVLALIVVLILILIVAWLLKKLGGGRFGATNSGQAELSIVDTLAIDPKRRLVLVRHGKLEHLLLIGGGSDEVVERSIVGGLPIIARMQANKATPPVPEKPAEVLARPSSNFLDRLERTSAARKSGAVSSEASGTPEAGEDKAASEDKTAPHDLAALGASAPAAEATTGRSAFATMVAATSKEEINSTPGAQSEKTATTAPPKQEAEVKTVPAAVPVPPAPLSAPEPIDLPPLPKPATLQPATRMPETSGSMAKPASPPSPPAGVSTPPVDRPLPKPLPKSEREALDQSLDAALHDSLLTPEPAKSDDMTNIAGAAQAPIPTEDLIQPAASSEAPAASPADDMDFNLFDDGELEREMEAALASTSASPEASPELDAQRTAAIEAELAIDLMTPSEPASVPDTPSAPSASTPSASAPSASAPSASHGPITSPDVASPPPISDAAKTSQVDAGKTDDQATVSGTETGPSADGDKAADRFPPYKDIPVELSRPDTVAVQIPSRGPAANATSVTKADNGITGERALPEGPSSPVDLSQLLETPSTNRPATPESTETKPASGKSSDLDEEMRRLLGEIAGDPKAN